MFVRYYLFIDKTFEEVEHKFLNPSQDWLQNIAQGVHDQNVKRTELGVTLHTKHLRKRVEMKVGEPLFHTHKKIVIPFTWHPKGVSGLFPEFDGDLEVNDWRSGTTQLAVSVRYDPPLGVVGRVLDRTAMHILAEAMVKDFLDAVASTITSPASQSKVS